MGSRAFRHKAKRCNAVRICLECLEERLVPASLAPAVSPLLNVGGPRDFSASGDGYTPSQIRNAYGISAISFGNTKGDGTGETIAIVDAFDDPTIFSDLDAFDQSFSLTTGGPTIAQQYGAASTFLSVVNQDGGTNRPSTDPTGGWEQEEALDVEWAHAIAPGAKIILVECLSDQSIDDLVAGVTTAAKLPGVSVVSMSWGFGEFTNEPSYDNDFVTPSGHQGVTFLAATGDYGTSSYPPYSPNVVAVGGTTLTVDPNGNYLGEVGWGSGFRSGRRGGGGGGISQFEPEPAYQDNVQNTGSRTNPDVSFDGDPNTGVPVYDSFLDGGQGPWIEEGGTSLATPAWGGLIAIANQGRALLGAPTLDGRSQTLPGLYSLPAADYHDIVGGSNGQFNAGPGYDEVTGIGTPVANLLVPGLAHFGLANDHLAITAQPPATVTTGVGFTVQVAVDTASGALDTTFNGTVTLSIVNNPGGSTLGGNATVTAQNGVARFTGITLNKGGAGYLLQASSSGMAPATTNPFNVFSTGPGSPPSPQLAPQSDTGASNSDGITRDDGSTTAPLVFNESGVNPPNAYVTLYDVTNPGNPIPLGSPVQATNGSASLELAGTPWSDGLHEISAAVSTSPGGAVSPFSLPTKVVIDTSLRVLSISPSTNYLTSLPNNEVVVTYSGDLAGLVPQQPNNRGFASAPFAVMLIPSGPDGASQQSQTGNLWSAPSGVDNGDLPVAANLVYTENGDGTSTITLTPRQPLSTDIYLIEVTPLTDLAGNTLTGQKGVPGPVFSSFDFHASPSNASPLQVVSITTDNGAFAINGSAIPQPDTIGIQFNKPLDTWTVNTNTIQLYAQSGSNSLRYIPSAVAYSPTTDSAYLTPEAQLVPGTVYEVVVNPSIADDQNFPNALNTLGQEVVKSFTVTNAPVGSDQSPLTVVSTNPPNGTAWTNALGYVSVTFSEGLDLQMLSRFAAMLIPQTGGATTGTSGYADAPYNAKLAFNPSTDQLIIVPTSPLTNGVVDLFAISQIVTAGGDALVNPIGSLPVYATFLLSANGSPHALVANASTTSQPGSSSTPDSVTLGDLWAGTTANRRTLSSSRVGSSAVSATPTPVIQTGIGRPKLVVGEGHPSPQRLFASR